MRTSYPRARTPIITTFLLASLAVPTVASAARPDADFMARWKRVDRLIAQSDLLGAEQALNPLLPIAPTLDPGAERFWFAVSAERVLGAFGRDAEAAVAVADALAATSTYGDPPRSLSPPGATTDRRRCNAGWQITGQHTFTPVGMWFGPRPPLHTETGDEYYDSKGNPRPGGYLAVRTSALPSQTYGGSANDGDSILIPSYFGGERTYRAPLGNGAKLVACNGLAVKGNGAPWAFGRYDYAKRTPIAVPASDPAVAKRRIARGGRLQAQVLAADGTEVTAWWTYPIRKGKRKLRTTAVVEDRRATIPAPKRKGQYNLRLTTGKVTKPSATIDGIGVGTKPYKFKTTYGRVCLDDSCSSSGGSSGGGRG